MIETSSGKRYKAAGAAGLSMGTTAGMAAAGFTLGSFADHSSSKQQLYVAKMLLNETEIHIHADKIYIGLNRLPDNGSI